MTPSEALSIILIIAMIAIAVWISDDDGDDDDFGPKLGNEDLLSA